MIGMEVSMEYIERYWRDATPADAIKEPPMVARFRDINYPWKINTLRGVRQGAEFPWFSESKGSFQQCQVYDAPDPGEGWRLVDVEKETPKEGDQYLVHPSQWIDRGDCHGCFKDDKFYRRRIEQPKPKYIPFTWEDREQLRGRWIVDRTGEQEYTIDDFLNDSGILYICGHPAEYFLNWTFLDTGEPVGKRVQ